MSETLSAGLASNPAHGWTIWLGRGLSALVVLALGLSAAMKLSGSAEVAKMFEGHFGYPHGVLALIGVLELACAVLYVIPKTSFFGAVLVAAYFGGAVATHVRVGEAFVIPVALGVMAWVGLGLRDARVRAAALRR